MLIKVERKYDGVGRKIDLPNSLQWNKCKTAMWMGIVARIMKGDLQRLGASGGESRASYVSLKKHRHR